MAYHAEVMPQLIAALIALATLYVGWMSKRSADASDAGTRQIEQMRAERMQRDTELNDRIDQLSEDLARLSIEIDALNKWRRSYSISPWRSGTGVGDWINDHNRDHERLQNRLNDLIEAAKGDAGTG